MARRVVTAVALVSFATLGAGFVSVPVAATTPGLPGRIVYQTDHADLGGYEVYTIGADGSGDTRLTTSRWQDHTPAWSPDGRKIAWESDAPSTYIGEIFVMNADGSDQVNISNTPSFEDREPAWSPDGSRIAFISYRNGAGYEVFVMDADGSDLVQLTNNNLEDRRPTWSPDGSRIAWTQNGYIMSMNAADGSGVVGLGSGYNPDWSPDGTRIAFSRSGGTQSDIYVMNVDGSNVVNITAGVPGLDDDYDPAWSPDGTRIVFSSDLVGADQLYSISPNGTGLFRITNTTWNSFAPSWQPLCTISGSPASETLLGTSGRDVICGLGGADTIRGYGGADVIFGGQGTDHLVGGGGNDVVSGQEGIDRVLGGAGSDLVSARDNASGDTVDGGLGVDKCVADVGDRVRKCP
jgi:Tol biopolymer transport system component